MIRIRYGAIEDCSDDFLVADVERLETFCGDPWSLLNPLRSVKAARGFLLVTLLRADWTEEDALAEVTGPMTLRQMRQAFTFEPDPDDSSQAPRPLDVNDNGSSGPKPDIS